MTSPHDDTDNTMDLLTAYAMDALEPEEFARVSALLEARPELRSTLAELRAVADQMPYALTPADPPPDLRQRVLDHATGRSRPHVSSPAAGMAVRARNWLLGLGSLAAVALVVAALGWAQVMGLQADLAATRTELASAQATAMAAQPLLASLQGEGGQARLLRADAETTVLVAQLRPLPPGRVYQLWRIQGGNAPASAGVFTVDQQGYGAIALPPGQQPQSGETLAVTDEPDGGSPAPTSAPLISGTLIAS